MAEQPTAIKKHVSKVLIACAVFALLGLAWFTYYWTYDRFYEETTDAYVNGNMISLNSQIEGTINAIYADNTDFVTEGQLLITLDETDAKLNLELKKDELAVTLRDVVSLFASVKQSYAQILAKEADLLVSYEEYQRRSNLYQDGSVSVEDFQSYEAKFISTQEELNALKYNYEGLLAEIQNTTVTTHPRVQKAKDELKEAWIHLKRCRIKAPATGLVAQRNAQVGAFIFRESPLLAVIPLNEMWVDANFKEVQLKKMRIGQRVKMKSDMYGNDIIFCGELVGLGGGTGSVFSVLPPQNATGNWIKIVQRIPVRVAFQPDQLKSYPLRLGLSMEVTVDLQKGIGPVIPPAIKEAILYNTAVFENQEKGVNELINQIIADNLEADGAD